MMPAYHKNLCKQKNNNEQKTQLFFGTVRNGELSDWHCQFGQF